MGQRSTSLDVSTWPIRQAALAAFRRVLQAARMSKAHPRVVEKPSGESSLMAGKIPKQDQAHLVEIVVRLQHLLGAL